APTGNRKYGQEPSLIPGRYVDYKAPARWATFGGSLPSLKCGGNHAEHRNLAPRSRGACPAGNGRDVEKSRRHLQRRHDREGRPRRVLTSRRCRGRQGTRRQGRQVGGQGGQVSRQGGEVEQEQDARRAGRGEEGDREE